MLIKLIKIFFGSISCLGKAIGAEYGEGFETFRPDGPLKIDVVSYKKVLFRLDGFF